MLKSVKAVFKKVSTFVKSRVFTKKYYQKVTQQQLDDKKAEYDTKIENSFGKIESLVDEVYKKQVTSPDAILLLDTNLKEINAMMIKNRKIRTIKAILNSSGKYAHEDTASTNEIIFLLGDLKQVIEKLKFVKRKCGRKKTLIDFVGAIDRNLSSCDNLYRKYSEGLKLRNKNHFVFAPLGMVA